MQSPNYFDIFRGTNGQWYWNLHNGGNHAIISTGGEGFVSQENAYRAVRNFVEDVKTAFIPESKPSMAQDDILDNTADDSEADEEPEEPASPEDGADDMELERE